MKKQTTFTAESDTKSEAGASSLMAEDIGKIYNVSGRCVHNWYTRGIIEAEIHVGKVIRFDPVKVRAALAAATAEKRAEIAS